jgi:hypothetical protein
MRNRLANDLLVAIGLVAAAIVALAPRTAFAHCDTLDGPVVRDARAALEAGDVTPVLKWVTADREAEIREAFEQTVAVRARGPEARALADRFFFETLVRVHRGGEGAPYTGLKPAGIPVDPGIAASDEALESGNVEPLVELITRRVDEGLRQRHARAVAARRHAGESVDRGRESVAAYVDLVHYAERLLSVAGPAPHAHDPEHSN